MARFLIANDNRIKRIALADTIHDGKAFATREQLDKLSGQWPGKRLVEIWNEIPGVMPVRKFTDRKTGIDRIWDALQQSCPEESISTARPDRAKHRKNSKKDALQRSCSEASPSAARPERTNVRKGSKSAEILNLLRRPAGATLKNLMTITGWQAHSVRGFISAAVGKKMGLQVASSRRKDGQRVYQVR